MTWSERDEILFSTVNIFGKEHLEAQIEEASEKFLTLKKRPNFFTIFGYYNLNKDIFVWQNDMNTISYDMVKGNYMSLLKTDETLKKLFQPIVHFEKKDMNVIPYLMEALNARFSVVRFKGPNDYIYALTQVEGVDETFKYEDLDAALFTYRMHNQLDKVLKKKHKKQKNRHRTHKKKIRD